MLKFTYFISSLSIILPTDITKQFYNVHKDIFDKVYFFITAKTIRTLFLLCPNTNPYQIIIQTVMYYVLKINSSNHTTVLIKIIFRCFPNNIS